MATNLAHHLTPVEESELATNSSSAVKAVRQEEAPSVCAFCYGTGMVEQNRQLGDLYVEAIGGELEIIARFEDEAIRINQLDELDIPNEEPAVLASETINAGPNAGVNQNVKVAVFEQSQSPATKGVNLWSGAGSNTGSSRTPEANTTSPTAKAA